MLFTLIIALFIYGCGVDVARQLEPSQKEVTINMTPMIKIPYSGKQGFNVLAGKIMVNNPTHKCGGLR